MIIHKDDIPQLRWPMAVIVKVYPGSNNNIRIAFVKTVKGLVKRLFSEIKSVTIAIIANPAL